MRARSRGPSYDNVLADVVRLVDAARRGAVRSVNAIMTATYWAIGRRIVEQEQHGAVRAGYGEELIVRLSKDLQSRFGRGFGRANLFQMRAFYLAYRAIIQTTSGESAPAAVPEKIHTVSGQSAEPDDLVAIAGCFSLPWSHYVRLLTVRNPEARKFYEKEALRGGWTIRQLGRQIGSQFYERTILSKNTAAMLRRGGAQLPDDALTPEEEIKEPFLLEFLALKDEYSETDLESALIAKLESFLLELGGDFAFVGRQRRLRVGNEWYRLDLLFFHRRLRCLMIIDDHRPQARQVHTRRRRTDASVPQLCPRALGAAWREPARRAHPLRREGPRRGQVRPRRVAEQGARSRVPDRPSQGAVARPGDRKYAPTARGGWKGFASPEEAKTA
jgi:predicted nuclease of restriction endonuclease-like (RecB) superfamily